MEKKNRKFNKKDYESPNKKEYDVIVNNVIVGTVITDGNKCYDGTFDRCKYILYNRCALFIDEINHGMRCDKCMEIML